MANRQAGPRNSYRGPITDTSRWDNFVNRADDIFICTPVKHGTTWTQAICAMLVFGTANHGKKPNEISPWIDASFEPIHAYLARVDAQDHRRFFKTHTPFDGLPYFESCTYIVVLRDPRDAYLSGIKHRDNWNNEELPHLIFPSGDDPFLHWLYYEREPNAWDIQSLEYITHFLMSYWPYSDLPNVHLYHYSDMLQNLRGSIESMARATGTRLTKAQLDEFTAAASFDSMKEKAEQYAPFADIGMWHDNNRFFASGKSGSWRTELSDQQQRSFLARIEELLPSEPRKWLLRDDDESVN